MKSLYKDADAQRVAEEILTLGEEVTAEEVVNLARDPGTELHRCFEWDDTVAAEKWRRHQARQIFCNLVIQRPPEEGKEARAPVRFFYNNGKSYKTSSLIFTKPSEYQELLQRALAELKSFQQKYSMLSELDSLLKLISELAA